VNRVALLMYHIVDRPLSQAEARFCCAPARFEAHMRHLAEYGLAVSLEDLHHALVGRGQLPTDAVAVTFDDGFAATFEHALPILKRYRIPATMFIVSGRIGGYNDWMTPRGFPTRPLVTKQQIVAMRDAGLTIGSHTRNHPRLPGLPAQNLLEEISGSRADLEGVLAERVNHFAYPFGQYDIDSREMVKASGYSTACSTRAGFNNAEVGRFDLRRLEVYGWDSLWRLRQKMKYGRNESSVTFPAAYYLSRARIRLGF